MAKRSNRRSTSPRRGRVVGRRWVLAGGGAAVAAAALGAFFWDGAGGDARRAYALAPESVLPPDIQRASPGIREAYRFAIANRDTLRYIPCFCGCGAEGHSSNASCYLKDSSSPEKLELDRMSLG